MPFASDVFAFDAAPQLPSARHRLEAVKMRRDLKVLVVLALGIQVIHHVSAFSG